MTMDQIRGALLREYPNGVSFDPMALRLVRQKISLEESQVESLKSEMFQMGDGLWFSHEMVSQDGSLSELLEQAEAWLAEHGCFSVEALFALFDGTLRHAVSSENLETFLRYQDFEVTKWAKNGAFCFQPSHALDECLAEASKAVAQRLEEAGGTLALHEIEEMMPHLSQEALGGICASLLPDVHEVEIGELTCWRSSETIPLPEDFAEQLTTVVDTLVALGEKVTPKNLQFALNLSYRIRFREEYALHDNRTFMQVCGQHYQGPDGVFPKARTPRMAIGSGPAAGKRTRRPNTRFGDLSVPVGAELVFTKDGRTTCTVLNDTNQVEYEGEAFAISALAVRLLDVSVANGFSHFSYEGENLWERRDRLERVRGGAGDAREEVLPTTRPEAEGEVIGLGGKPLSLATWQSYRTDGTGKRVAEWARRIDSGESAEQIAAEAGYAASTVRVQVCNHRLYYKVCKLNGITPEAGADV